MLGTVFFLLYINDLPNEISSTIRLYADDIIIYRYINSNEDVLKLQEDLVKLTQWAKDWLMQWRIQDGAFGANAPPCGGAILLIKILNFVKPRSA